MPTIAITTPTDPAAVAPESRLRTRVLSGMRWSGASVVLNLLFQLGTTAVMARLLAPSAFGLTAAAAVGLRLCSYLSQVGLSVSIGLVQRPVLAERDVRFALGVTLLASTVAASVLVAAAPCVARFFHQPALVPVLQVLALQLPLQGLAAVPLALLRRAFRFRALAVLESASYLLGYGAVGISCALGGVGAWSLVAALLAQSALQWLIGYALTRHPLKPTLRGARGSLLHYGARHTLVSFVEFLGANLDAALIGRWLGDTALGLYNRSLMLANQPIDRAASIVTRVLFPLLAKLQSRRDQVAALLVLGVGAIGVVGAAVCVALSAAAVDVVAVLLGARWHEAVPLLRVLPLAIPLAFMSNIAGVLCDGLALLRLKLAIQCGALVALAALMLAGAQAGLLGIAWALVAGEALRLIAYLLLLRRELPYRLADVWRVLAATAFAGAAAWLLVALATRIAHVNGWPSAAALLADMAAGAVALAGAALMLVRLLSPGAAGQLAASQFATWPRLARLARVSGAHAT